MFCPNCGTQIEDGSVFCPECGAKVNDAPVMPDQPAAPYQPDMGYQSAPAYQPDMGYQSAPAYQPDMGYQSAPAAPAKKGLSKGALIGIIAGGVAVVALALVLILTLGGVKGKLVGTWSKSSYGVELSLTFKANGTGEMKLTGYGETESEQFKWSVDGQKNLRFTFDDSSPDVYKWSKEAKDGDDDYWYIDGKTLYFEGLEFTKK